MFEKHSKTNEYLITIASVAFLINIFISVLSYANNENVTSILIIIVSAIALLINFFVWKKSKNPSEK